MSALLRLQPVDRPTWFYLTIRACGFDEQKLARRCGVGLRQLQRQFKQVFGRRPKDWVNEQRMLSAAYLLRETGNVGLVARRLGYSRRRSFSREFKRRHRVTPSQYLAIYRKLRPDVAI